MPRYAQSERRSLVELMADLGPDAPTLNAGWAVRDLAAHLVVRERRPDAAAGIVLAPLRHRAERVQRELAARPFGELLDLLRQPPAWSPTSNRLADEAVNLLEFFVHHEDVRRAQPGWQPRPLPAQQQQKLWKRAPMMARMSLRRFPASVTVRAPGHGELTTGAGGESVTLEGEPAELVLFLFGRQPVAQVQLTGAVAEVERLREAKLGI